MNIKNVFWLTFWESTRTIRRFRLINLSNNCSHLLWWRNTQDLRTRFKLVPEDWANKEQQLDSINKAPQLDLISKALHWVKRVPGEGIPMRINLPRKRNNWQTSQLSQEWVATTSKRSPQFVLNQRGSKNKKQRKRFMKNWFKMKASLKALNKDLLFWALISLNTNNQSRLYLLERFMMGLEMEKRLNFCWIMNWLMCWLLSIFHNLLQGRWMTWKKYYAKEALVT